MKSYQPDSGGGSDPFWGGLFSRRTDHIVSALVIAVIVVAWLLGGRVWGGGALFVAFLLWGWAN